MIDRTSPLRLPDRERVILGPVNRKDIRRVELAIDGIPPPEPATVSALRDVLVGNSGGQWGQACSATTGAVLTTVGVLSSSGAAPIAVPTTPDAYGVPLRLLTAGASGSDASLTSGGTAVFLLSQRPAFLFKFKSPLTATSIRFFAGLTATTTAATELGADNSGQQNVGLQFSTARGDTNWQFIRRDASAQTVFDTGVAFAAATVLYLEVLPGSSSSVTLILRDSAGAVLAEQTFGSGLPVSSTALMMLVGVRTLTGATREWQLYNANVVVDAVTFA